MAKVGFVSKVQSVGIDSVKAGLIGGLAVGLLSRLMGRTIGAAVGGILAGAFIDGTDGRIVAINSIQDAVTVAVA